MKIDEVQAELPERSLKSKSKRRFEMPSRKGMKRAPTNANYFWVNENVLQYPLDVYM